MYGDDISKLDVWPGGLLETTTQGPGELFQHIIKDQFIRIRDGDWFWFENRDNDLFTDEEIATIHATTLKHIIVENTNISVDDIQDNVFIVDEQTKCVFKPLEAKDMENCTEWQTFDYFTGSEVSYTVVFVLTGLFIVSLFVLMYTLARRRKTMISRNVKNAKTSSCPASVSDEIVHGVQTIRVLELKSEQGDRPVLIFIRTQPYQEILITDDNSQKLRSINLKFKQLTLQNAVDDPTLLLLRVPRTHDFIMRYSTKEGRDFFSRHLKRQMEEVGAQVNVEEMHSKDLLNKAITKRRRQKLVAEFLREVFEHASDEQQGKVDDAKLKQRVLDCQLTKDEFAESLSLKSDSLFVDQMFRLADADGDGAVTFREFFNLIVVFTHGTADAKLHLMFDLYDIQHCGYLDRNSFKEMFVAMMEMVNATIDTNSLNQLCDSMFTSAGLHQKDHLAFDDFRELLHGHKDALADLNLNMQVQGHHTSPLAKRKKRSLTTSLLPFNARKLRHTQSELGPRPEKYSLAEEKAYSKDSNSLPDICTTKETSISADATCGRSCEQHGSGERLHLDLAENDEKHANPHKSSKVYRYKLNVARAYFSPLDAHPPSSFHAPTSQHVETLQKSSLMSVEPASSWLDRKFYGSLAVIENYKRQIFFLVLYHLIVLAIFAERAYCKAFSVFL